MIGPELAALVEQHTAGWDGERRRQYVEWLAAKLTRDRMIARCANPADLAREIDENYTVTPALQLIAEHAERALREPGHDLLVTMPPQEGKSTLLAVFTPLRALQIDPDTRIVLTTYADALAEEHSAACRSIVKSHGTGAVDSFSGRQVPDLLGFRVAADKSAVSRWRVEGRSGGMVAVGMGSSITGRRADLLIIDDPYKNAVEADSAAHRAKVSQWLRTVALTRLSPGASVILVQTRWHENDIAGEIIAGGLTGRNFERINIPAISAAGTPDALGREPGVAMISARGRTAADFETTRAAVGERVFWAMYQGEPTPPAGGLFDREWFTRHAVQLPPAYPLATIVAVDPAETGQGDEAGIVAASIDADKRVTFTHDRSGHMTSDQWARAAVRLALQIGASEIAVESYTAGTTYSRVIAEAFDKLVELGETAQPMPFRVHSWRGTGDDVARSGLLRQAFETGKARVVDGDLDELIAQAVKWQTGQHQPDRVAAAVIAYDRVSKVAGSSASYASPVRSASSAPGKHAWLQRRIG